MYNWTAMWKEFSETKPLKLDSIIDSSKACQDTNTSYKLIKENAEVSMNLSQTLFFFQNWER